MPASPTAIVPALLGVGFGLSGRMGAAAAFGGIAIGLVHLTVLAPRFLRRVDAAFASVGRMVAAASMLVGQLVIVIPVWALQRMARFDPLDDPRGRGRWRPAPVDGWQEPNNWARSQFSPQLPSSWRRRLHGQFVVALPVVVAIAVFGSVVGVRALATRKPDRTVADPADRGAPAYVRVVTAETNLSGLRYDAVTGFRAGEVNGEYVHVHDRVRRSYEPPGKSRETVWFLGGSTMFGFPQRDDHTIPSAFAQSAAADGLTVRVVNYGVSGYVNWQEVQLFQLLLAQGHKPDLAVFYDGCNETALTLDRVTHGEPHPGDPRYLESSQIEMDIGANTPDTPQTEPKQAVPVASQLSTAIARGAAQYSEGVALASRLAASYGVPVRFVWQPTLATKQPWRASDRALVAGLPFDPWGGAPRLEITQMEHGILQQSGVKATDLTGALDRFPGAPYYDGCHTNEAAAAKIGLQLYRSLRPALAAAAHG